MRFSTLTEMTGVSRATVFRVKNRIKNGQGVQRKLGSGIPRKLDANNKRRTILRIKQSNISLRNFSLYLIFTKYIKWSSYKTFRKVFNSCNIKFKKPRTDICETCDEFDCQKTKAKREKNLNILNDLQNRFAEHKLKANMFYELKRKVKDENKFNSKVNIICYDFQKICKSLKLMLALNTVWANFIY